VVSSANVLLTDEPAENTCSCQLLAYLAFCINVRKARAAKRRHRRKTEQSYFLDSSCGCEVPMEVEVIFVFCGRKTVVGYPNNTLFCSSE